MGKSRRLVACRQETVDELRESQIKLRHSTLVVGPQLNAQMVVTHGEKWVMINLFGQRHAGRGQSASDFVANGMVKDQVAVGENPIGVLG